MKRKDGEEQRRRGQNEGSIYQRSKDGRWVGAVTLDNGKRKAFYGRTRAEVARKVSRALTEMEQGLAPADDRITVKVYLESWLDKTVKPSKRYSTWRGYEQVVRLYLVPEIGKTRLSKLSPDDVEDMVNRLSDRGLSPRTVQYTHAVLRVALQKAVRHGKVPRNVAALVSPPPVKREPVEPLTKREAKALLKAAAGDPLEALYVVTLALGLRRGEVCGLQWSDVDLKTRRLFVRRALQTQKGKGLVEVEPKSRSSRRALPIPPFAVVAFKEHRKRQAAQRLSMGSDWRAGNWIFTMEDGRPVAPDYVNVAFPRLLKRAKIRHIRFHDLRHSCASFLFAQGCEMRLVMEILGHSQIALTANTYTHLLPEGDRRAADAMQSLFG